MSICITNVEELDEPTHELILGTTGAGMTVFQVGSAAGNDSNVVPPQT